jgi:HAD superfamily hydrolase (TIGR01509 family)
MQLKAVIFDMDGVIVDSERQWQLCEEELFRRHVPTWSQADHHKIVGLGVEDLYHYLVKDYGISSTKADFLKDCHEIAEIVYKERVKLTPGFRRIVTEIERRGMPIGLASSSPKVWILGVLERFSIHAHFSAVASADDVPKGRTKPEPDIYLHALKGLGLGPEGVLAVEDSALGVRAAKAAGLRCAGFRNGHNDAQNLSAADFEISALADLLTDPAGRSRTARG